VRGTGRLTGDDGHPGWRKVVDSVAELCGKAADGAMQPRPAAPRSQSICVLPFTNLSGDPKQGYFSDGISEDIVTDLSKVIRASRPCWPPAGAKDR
jgi:adenylate cyclase